MLLRLLQVLHHCTSLKNSSPEKIFSPEYITTHWLLELSELTFTFDHAQTSDNLNWSLPFIA